MNKLKSFTIIELIVVLIISSILIVLITSVYSNFNKYFQKSLANQKAANEILWISVRLKSDIINSEYVIANNNSLILQYKDRTVTYDIYSDKIVFSNGLIQDSIKVKISDINTGFISPGIVNYLYFTYDYKGQQYVFCQNKTYSNRCLFNIINK